MAARPGVIIVGSLHVDLVAVAPRLPRRGETLPGSSFAIHPGGKAGNQAVQVARCGVPAFLVARVGADAFGALVRDALSGAGVDLTSCATDDDAPTGASTVLVGEDGDYASVVVPGAGSRLDTGDIERARPALAGSAVLLLQLETPLAASAHAAAIAHAMGLRVVLNAAPAAHDAGTIGAAFGGALDVLIVNAVEAEQLGGDAVGGPGDAARVARVLRDRLRVPNVVVTLGGEGAVGVFADETIRIRGHRVRVVDTIGAGDAFAGATAAWLAIGADLRTAIAAGNAAGALAVTRAGAFDGLPERGEIEAMMDR